MNNERNGSQTCSARTVHVRGDWELQHLNKHEHGQALRIMLIPAPTNHGGKRLVKEQRNSRCRCVHTRRSRHEGGLQPAAQIIAVATGAAVQCGTISETFVCNQAIADRAMVWKGVRQAIQQRRENLPAAGQWLPNLPAQYAQSRRWCGWCTWRRQLMFKRCHRPRWSAAGRFQPAVRGIRGSHLLIVASGRPCKGDSSRAPGDDDGGQHLPHHGV